jgi:hypothetical protein
VELVHADIRAGTLHVASAATGDAGHYTLEVVYAGGAILSGPTTVSVYPLPTIDLSPRVSVPVGGAARVTPILGGADAVQWSRWIGDEWVVLPVSGGTDLEWESLAVSDAGWYRVEASNAAGRKSAETLIEVYEPASGSGSTVGGDSGNGGAPLPRGGGIFLAGEPRWWVYESFAVESSSVRGGVRFWVYDRILQRSAWVSTGVADAPGDVTIWDSEDQLVLDRSVPQGGLWSVRGLRFGVTQAGRWEGFELAGSPADQFPPRELRGRYELLLDEEGQDLRLQWSAQRTHHLEDIADWQQVLQFLATESPGAEEFPGE